MITLSFEKIVLLLLMISSRACFPIATSPQVLWASSAFLRKRRSTCRLGAKRSKTNETFSQNNSFQSQRKFAEGIYFYFLNVRGLFSGKWNDYFWNIFCPKKIWHVLLPFWVTVMQNIITTYRKTNSHRSIKIVHCRFPGLNRWERINLNCHLNIYNSP